MTGATWHDKLPKKRKVTCSVSPHQEEGFTNDGSFFYFRYRFNHATLGFGDNLDEAVRNAAYNGSQVRFDGLDGDDLDGYRGVLMDNEVDLVYEMCLEALGFERPA